MISCVDVPLPKRISEFFLRLLLKRKLSTCPPRFFAVVLECEVFKMKKGIYGIIDNKSHNFGDLCILDKDDEFKAGCLELFSNPDIPEYITNDLIAVCYGSIVYDSEDTFPKFDIAPAPRFILFGMDENVLKRREERNSDPDEET